jgi:hypothetical protein
MDVRPVVETITAWDWLMMNQGASVMSSPSSRRILFATLAGIGVKGNALRLPDEITMST